MYDIKRLRELRKVRGLTQTALAARSGVAQSVIARIEAGEVDPRLSTVQKLFGALQSTSSKPIRAADLMTRRVLSVSPDDEIKKAIRIMRRHGISQLPVIQKEKIIGSIAEASITKAIDMQFRYVKDVMNGCLPMIDICTPFETINSLLKHSQAVLVVSGGKLKGIITRADLLRVI